MDKDGNVDKKRVLKAKHRYALLAKVRHTGSSGLLPDACLGMHVISYQYSSLVCTQMS